MNDIPRRTLSELAFIYNQDPERRDIYVEGPFDAAVINWFIRECTLPRIAVYPITAIEIPDGDLIKVGKKTNNRERLVFLSEFLLANAVQRVACVVDSDFSRIRSLRPAEPPLYETDYACMEMYFFCFSSFNKFIMLFCRRSDWPVKTIMDSLMSSLQEFFLFRCANDELEWQMDWLDKISCMNVDGWAINFDADMFITRLLNKNGKATERDAFVRCVERIRPNLKADPRHQMNGHDLINLIAWYIRRKGISGAQANANNVRMCMIMTLDLQALKQELLFRKLSARLA